jgi:hypothetical protein
MDLPALGVCPKQTHSVWRYLVKRLQQSPTLHKAYHNGQWCANCAVLASVHVCGHGWESLTAGILLAIIIVGLLLFKETNL